METCVLLILGILYVWVGITMAVYRTTQVIGEEKPEGLDFVFYPIMFFILIAVWPFITLSIRKQE